VHSSGIASGLVFIVIVFWLLILAADLIVKALIESTERIVWIAAAQIVRANVAFLG